VETTLANVNEGSKGRQLPSAVEHESQEVAMSLPLARALGTVVAIAASCVTPGNADVRGSDRRPAELEPDGHYHHHNGDSDDDGAFKSGDGGSVLDMVASCGDESGALATTLASRATTTRAGRRTGHDKRSACDTQGRIADVAPNTADTANTIKTNINGIDTAKRDYDDALSQLARGDDHREGAATMPKVPAPDEDQSQSPKPERDLGMHEVPTVQRNVGPSLGAHIERMPSPSNEQVWEQRCDQSGCVYGLRHGAQPNSKDEVSDPTRVLQGRCRRVLDRLKNSKRVRRGAG